MNLKSVDRQEKCLVVLEIQVEKQEFEQAVETAFRKNAHKVNVPGFRKGKAPRKMIERMYGEGVFYEDAVNLAYPAAYDKAVEEAGIDPVERADIQVTDLSADGFTFTAGVHVRPEISLKLYKGLEAKKEKAEVSDEDVAVEVERLQKRNARQVDLERALQKDDIAIIDYEGFIDGVPFEGGKGEKARLTIGSGQFIPGFEEQLIGVSPGESASVKVTFPEDYHAEDLRAKEAEFAVTVHEAKEMVLPELDDEFAKDVSEFDTLEEWKNSIRDKLMEQREREVDDAFENAVVDKLIEGFEGEIPEVMIDTQLENILQDMAYRLSMNGLDFETYLKITGQTLDEMRDKQRETARKQVICELSFEEVAKLEGFEISDEELDKEYERLSAQYQMPVDSVKASIAAKNLRRDLLGLKGAQFVRENAVVLDA